jgi:hypothetical protein
MIRLQSYTFFAKLQTHWQKNRRNSGCQALDVKFGSHLFFGKSAALGFASCRLAYIRNEL